MKSSRLLPLMMILVTCITPGCRNTVTQPDLTGSLVGYVYTFNEYAELLPDHRDVLITAIGLKPYETYTNNTGRFEFKSLPAGTYELHIEKEGFGTLKQFGIKHLGGTPTVLVHVISFDYDQAFFIYQMPTSIIQNLSISNDTLHANFAFNGSGPEHITLQLYFSFSPNFEASADLMLRSVYLERKQGSYTGKVYSDYLPFDSMKIYIRARVLNRCFGVLDFGDIPIRGIDTYYNYADHSTIYPNIGDVSDEYTVYFP